MSDAFAFADGANRQANLIRFGVITQVQPGPPTLARVQFEDTWVSDFLPVFQLASGSVRAWSVPVTGEQVCVLSPTGEPSVGAILRGLPCNAFPEASGEPDLTVIGKWDDGATDTYDAADKARTIAIPAGGKLTLAVGVLTIRIEGGGITLDAGGAPAELVASKITLRGPVDLGGAGGQPVARVGDAVVAGKIAAGSASVKAV